MRTYYFTRDIRFKEFEDAGIKLVDNRNRAADYGEVPFILEDGESFVMIERYNPSEDGDISNYTTGKVEGNGFGGDILTKLDNIFGIVV